MFLTFGIVLLLTCHASSKMFYLPCHERTVDSCEEPQDCNFCITTKCSGSPSECVDLKNDNGYTAMDLRDYIEMEIKYNQTSNEMTWNYTRSELPEAANATITFYRWSTARVSNSRSQGSSVHGCCGIPITAGKCKLDRCEIKSTFYWSVNVGGAREGIRHSKLKTTKCAGQKRQKSRKTIFFPQTRDQKEIFRKHKASHIVLDLLTGQFKYDMVQYESLLDEEKYHLQHKRIFDDVCVFQLNASIVDHHAKPMERDEFLSTFFGRPVYNFTTSVDKNQIRQFANIEAITCQRRNFSLGKDLPLPTNHPSQHDCFFTWYDWPRKHTKTVYCLPQIATFSTSFVVSRNERSKLISNAFLLPSLLGIAVVIFVILAAAAVILKRRKKAHKVENMMTCHLLKDGKTAEQLQFAVAETTKSEENESHIVRAIGGSLASTC